MRLLNSYVNFNSIFGDKKLGGSNGYFISCDCIKCICIFFT